MAAGDRLVPDWRDAAAYVPLLDADRSFFAWEWLRRNRSYREAAERAHEARSSGEDGEAGEAPERWGLHAFELPGLTVPEARPVWCAEVDPHVLGIHAGPPAGEDVFNLERFATMSTLLTAEGREHLLITDGLRTIRIDVLMGSIARGPVGLRYQLTGLSSAERPLLTLRRLLALWRGGRFCRSLHPGAARAKRWLLMLRTQDALATGANQRAIAAELLGSSAARERWRVEAPSLRTQAQRLVQCARRMAEGEFWNLLR